MCNQRDAFAFELPNGKFGYRSSHGALRSAEGAEHVTRRRNHRTVAGCVEHHVRNFLARDKFLRRDGRGSARTTMQDERIVDSHQLFDDRDHLVRAAFVIFDHDFNPAAVDAALFVRFLVPHLRRLEWIEAKGSERPRHRREQANSDFGIRDTRIGGLRARTD